jgi:hypothetical protein
MPVNYQLGKIYKIVDLSTDECYIGSTCEPTLARRLAGHLSTFKQYKAGASSYTTSYKILENGNYDIQLIEAYPCNNKMELHAREGYHIKNTDCVNKVVPNRTTKEYRSIYKHKFQKYNREYHVKNIDKIKDRRDRNKDRIRERTKQYRELNKDKYKDYYEKNKDELREYRQEYREVNKDKLRECQKEYYKLNKSKILTSMSKPYKCMCGSICRSGAKARHYRSLKHKSFDANLENYILQNNPTLDDVIDFIK